jgi:hypothetical protein
MRGTILVIDGRGYPQPLLDLLEAEGYFCLYARGPLKVRTLLSEHTVDAIVWKDNTGNPALTQDLFREWGEVPGLPVLQVFSKGLRAAGPPLPAQVVGTLPAEAVEADLPGLLARTLAARSARAGASADPVRGSELAFRHILQTLREQQAPVEPAGRGDDGREPQLPPTALSATEREGLRPLPGSAEPPTVAGRLLAPLRRLARLAGAKRTPLAGE